MEEIIFKYEFIDDFDEVSGVFGEDLCFCAVNY